MLYAVGWYIEEHPPDDEVEVGEKKMLKKVLGESETMHAKAFIIKVWAIGFWMVKFYSDRGNEVEMDNIFFLPKWYFMFKSNVCV